MDKIKNRIKSVLRLFFEYKYGIAAAVLIICLVLSLVHYLGNGNMAYATVSFNYSEASNGLNPNKTRFNSYEILSDAVMTSAVELAGLQDSIDAKELAKHITLSPVDSGNSSGDDNYISTTYSVFLDASGLHKKNRTAMDLLANVCNAYKAYFLENNGDNQEILKIRLGTSEQSEPYLRLNEIKLRANQLEKYIDARMSQNKAFTDEKTGETFDAYEKRLQNIIDYDIPNASAYITECGIAKDNGELTQILEYKNKMDTMYADKQMAYYSADNNGIAMYEKLMSSIIMIPTLDETDQYYMSRTKTAMDKMARNADSQLSEATSYKKEIVSTNYVMEKMRKNESNEEKLASARGMINKLEKNLDDISADLLSFDKSYLEYKQQNYITVNYSRPSFLQQIGIKKTVYEVVFLLLLLACGFYLYILRKERKSDEKV